MTDFNFILSSKTCVEYNFIEFKGKNPRKKTAKIMQICGKKDVNTNGSFP